MSGDVTEQALSRLSHLPGSDNPADLIAAQKYYDVEFTGGEISGVDIVFTSDALNALEPLTPAANKLAYYTGADNAALTDITAAARGFLDDATAADQRNTLQLGALAVEDIVSTDLIDDEAVTYAKIQFGTARSVVGVSGNSSAQLDAIQGSANQVLRVNTAGTSLGFGSTLDAVTLGGTTPAAGTFTLATSNYYRFTSTQAASGTGIYQSATNEISVSTNGVVAATVAAATSGGNHIQLAPAGAGGLSFIGTSGTDTTGTLGISNQGQSSIYVYTGGDLQAEFAHRSSAANRPIFQAGATGNPATITCGETNGDLLLSGNGSGNVRFGTRTALGAETVTGYIIIKDAGGTLRKLAVVS